MRELENQMAESKWWNSFQSKAMCGKILCLMLTCLTLLLVSCHSDPDPVPHISRQTVMIFMPWSTNMDDFFEENLEDFGKAIAEGALTDERVVVCFATDASKAIYMELRQENGKVVRDTLQTITHPDYTRSGNLTSMFLDLSRYAPAHRYSLIIGGHGMAWLPVGTQQSHSPAHRVKRTKRPETRWFGGLSPAYQIEISTLAESIAAAQLHFDYILFDDCYMSSVEVAYDLRKVTDHVIACPTEIMAYGFPYHQCARYLVGDVDYQRLCDTFLSFYSSYYLPYGTVAVTDCRQLQALADVVRTINVNFRQSHSSSVPIQTMDGYDPTLFFDLGDTFDKICPDATLLAQFHEQLSRTVPYKASTEYYYSAGGLRFKVNHFSGITTSETSGSDLAGSYQQTAWYRATH